MRAISTVLFALLTACDGGGSKQPDALLIIPDAPPDAPPDDFEFVFDFSCLGNAAPTTAAANVTLAGFVGEAVVNGTNPAIQAAHNATVDICKTPACLLTDKLNSKTTPMNGCPAMGCPFMSDPLATNSMPLNVYAKVSKGTTTHWTSNIYPAVPVVANVQNIPAVMFTNQLISGLALAGINQDANKSIMLVAVTDCSNMPVTDTPNITISVKQGGQDVQGTTVVDASTFAGQLAGTFAIFNVPAGPNAGAPDVVTEVGAKYKDKTLLKHDVHVSRGQTTATQVRPGY